MAFGLESTAKSVIELEVKIEVPHCETNSDEVISKNISPKVPVNTCQTLPPSAIIAHMYHFVIARGVAEPVLNEIEGTGRNS